MGNQKTKTTKSTLTTNNHQCKLLTHNSLTSHTEWLSEDIFATAATESSAQWLTWMGIMTSLAVYATPILLKNSDRYKQTNLQCRHRNHSNQCRTFSNQFSKAHLVKFHSKGNFLHKDESLHKRWGALKTLDNHKDTPDLLQFHMEMVWTNRKYKPLAAQVDRSLSLQSISTTRTTFRWIWDQEEMKIHSNRSKECLACQWCSLEVTWMELHKAKESQKSILRICHQWRLTRKLIAIFALRKLVQMEIKAVNYHADMLSIRAA